MHIISILYKYIIGITIGIMIIGIIIGGIIISIIIGILCKNLIGISWAYKMRIIGV